MKNKKLTVRKHPLEGETLSSFLYRLSRSNGIPMLQLWNTIKDQYTAHYAQWNDINIIDFAPINTINIKKLSEYLDLETEILLNCTFYNVLCLFCGNSEIERSRFLSGILRKKLHYCPDCFKEKTYHKLLWKIESIEGCLKHGVKLLDNCFHCNKDIKYKDIKIIGICPYCDQKLSKIECNQKLDQSELENVIWYTDIWNYLLKSQSQPLDPSEIAIRILYLMNNKSNNADLNNIEKNMRNPGVFPTLLQHARNSLSFERTLHISFILNTLKENNVGIAEFLELVVPSTFVNSIRTKSLLKIDKVSCQAPWCSSYKKAGSLKKTGTSLKRKVNGRTLKYYMVCYACGCEYAFNEDDDLEERTYFIEAYNKINAQENRKSSLKEIMLTTNYTADKLKRCLAYFRSRNVLEDLEIYNDLYVKEELLTDFIKAIESGELVKSIENWNCWEGYNDFLTYRYHIKVIQTIHKQKVKVLKIDPQKKDEINDLLEDMYIKDEDISLKVVCEKLGVCAETIRNWGCNKIISNMKEKQKTQRRLAKKESIYSKVDAFLLNKKNIKLSADEIYNHIKINRTILWRIAPEITAYIDSRRRSHNR